MRKLSKKQFIAAGAATVIVAAGAGAAYAYWTTSGSGTGTATTGDSSTFVVTVDSTDVKDLTPGGATRTVSFHVQNTNSGVQRLQNTVATVAKTSNAGCDAADFAVSATTITYGDIASGATKNGTFTVQMINRDANQDACKNAAVTLQVDAS